MDVPEATPSSESPLVFQGRLNSDDVVHLRKYLGLLILRKSLRWVIGVFVTFLAGLCAWSIIQFGASVGTVGFLVFWAYLLFVTPLERRWTSRWVFRKNEKDYLETRVVLTPDRVKIENEAQRSDLAWRLVGAVGDTPEGILFCDRSLHRPLFWLPRRLFEGNHLREKVLELASRNGVRIRRLS